MEVKNGFTECCKKMNSCDILRVILRTLQCPDVENFNRRLEENFDKLFTLCTYGICLNNLTAITKLLLLVFDKLEISNVYRTYLFQTLKIFSRPLILLKSSDVVEMSKDIENLFSVFGILLGSSQDFEINRAILQVLNQMVQIAKTKCFFYKGVVLEGFPNSQLPAILAELLIVTDFDMYVEVLTIVEKLLVTQSICEAFIQQNVIDIVMQRLSCYQSEYCKDDELLKMSLPVHYHLSENILWTFLNAYFDSSKFFKSSVVPENIITERGWRSARNIFLIVVAQREHRNIRNKFFLLIRTLASSFPVRFSKALHYEILRLTFCTEIPQDSWVSQIRFQPDNHDFEFKLALMSILGERESRTISAYSLKQLNAIAALLKLLTPKMKLIWSSGQRNHLMAYALITLENIVAGLLEDFVAFDGPAKLINLLELVLSDRCPITLLLPVLRCIRTTLITNSSSSEINVAQEYTTREIATLLLRWLRTIINSQCLEKMSQDSLIITFSILTKLNESQKMCISGIIDVSLELLHRFLEPHPYDVFLDPKGIIAIVDFLWESALNSQDVLCQFVASGGIFKLLDVIESYPIAIKMIGLSMLVDLCELDYGFPCALTWRGKNGDRLEQLLMKIYRKQSRLDKDYDINPLSCDIENELMTTQKESCSVSLMAEPAIAKSKILSLDLLGSCKPKIYAILHMLKCHKQVHSINQTYQLNPSLSTSDKVTFWLAEYYFQLKMGESWLEVDNQLQRWDVRPLIFDEELILHKIKEYRKCTEFIQSEQQKCLLEIENKEKHEEINLYNKLKDGVLLESLESLNELKYQARCIDNTYRLSEIRKTATKLNYLEHKSKDSLVKYHTTFPRTSVRAALSQNINVGHHMDVNYIDTIGEEIQPTKEIESSLPTFDYHRS